MGYYSNLALERLEVDYDRSYATPEKQLIFRLDDLYDRLDILAQIGDSYSARTKLSDNDIRYAVPSYFNNISDVERAIELVMDELNFQKSAFYSSFNIKWLFTLRKKDLAICREYNKYYDCEEVQ